MTPALPTDLLAKLSDWATLSFGLRFPPDRWSELARGVASAALELGIPDLEGWAEHLASGPAAPEHAAAVANHLTISETYFFRHHETFAFLEKEILPARIAARRPHARALRLWSAGCASGEEPYSLAILLRERYPEVRPDTVVISATDINSRVLARAERGVYSEWSFRDVPEWVKAGSFQRIAAGRFEIAPELRKMVRFSLLNLAAPLYPAEFGERADLDVILCRNVLMYFSAAWQERIIARFHAALTDGGWLIVGPCDITAAQSAALHLRPVSPGIYQKSGHVPAATGTAPPLPSAFVAPAVEPPAPRHLEPAAPPPPPPAAPLPLEMPPLVAAATDGDVASARAISHADRGELEQALAACDDAVAADNTNPGYHYLRACILQEQNLLPEAAETFRRVLFLDPAFVMAEFALGCIAAKQGRRQQARHHFKVVLRLLGTANRGDAVPRTDGLTVGRLRAVVENNITSDAA